MKKTHILFIITGILLTSCFKTEVVPPLIFDGEANMTIAEFQKLHELSTTTPATLIDTAVIITGIVTSTDQFGSCYKEIFFQDTTGGLSIRINNTTYYARYRVGQRIFVKAKGLYLGNYVSGARTGFYQLGLYEDGGIEYISANKESQYIFRSDVPENLSPPKIITKESNIDKKVGGDYHTLVKLANCSFTQADGAIRYFEPSGNSTTISRNIQLGEGGNVEARISAYCTFANELLPEGTLNVTGLLTMFGNTPQIIIRSISDVVGHKVLDVFDMTTDLFARGWSNKQITGTDSWTYYAANKNVRIQPSVGNETECRLVSPKFNFNGEKDVALCFKYRLTAGTNENVQVLYSTDGENWNSLEFNPQIGNNIEAVLHLNDNIASNPNLQIAFQYKTNDIYPIWALLNIAFKTNVF
jgi:DNA/RNA endonuclease YhcR with UshA esterase domain